MNDYEPKKEGLISDITTFSVGTSMSYELILTSFFMLCSLNYTLFDTTFYDRVCQWLVTGQWFSLGTLVSSTNKTDHHYITEILLKVALNTINLNHRSECHQNIFYDS